MKRPVIVAIDTVNVPRALRLVDVLRDEVDLFKVGLTTYLAGGRELVQAIKGLGADVFLDLKLFDIPHQAAGAARAIARLGVKMFTVSAFGGIDMMSEAAGAAAGEAKRFKLERPLVLGVTVLTSLDEPALRQLGVDKSPVEQAVYLAGLARQAGLDGVIASGDEVQAIKASVGADFLVVVPGVRPEGAKKEDQRRVVSPAEAIARGADYVVVGRPVTEASDPLEAVRRLSKEVLP